MRLSSPAVAIAGLALALALTGCGATKGEPAAPAPVRLNGNNSDYTEKHILLNDGRTVLCLEWDKGSSTNSAVGLSCDWAAAEGTK